MHVLKRKWLTRLEFRLLLELAIMNNSVLLLLFFFFFLKKLNPQYLFLKIQSIKSALCKTYCVHNSFNRTCNCQLQENTWTFWRYHATALTRKQTGWSAGVRILPRRTTWKVCTECGIGVRNTRYMDPLIHVSKEK